VKQGLHPAGRRGVAFFLCIWSKEEPPRFLFVPIPCTFAKVKMAKGADRRVGGSTVSGSKGRLFLPRYTRFQQDFMGASDGMS
jgi:hypothetical protein